MAVIAATALNVYMEHIGFIDISRKGDFVLLVLLGVWAMFWDMSMIKCALRNS